MRMIFVNLPVNDVAASHKFFGQLGFDFNLEFSDDNALCMVVEKNIYVMLLSRERFSDFITDEVADARTSTEVITSVSASSKQEVDELVTKAIEAGGKRWKSNLDENSMYVGSFQDIDGHVWEVVHMEQPA